MKAIPSTPKNSPSTSCTWERGRRLAWRTRCRCRSGSGTWSAGGWPPCRSRRRPCCGSEPCWAAISIPASPHVWANSPIPRRSPPLRTPCSRVWSTRRPRRCSRSPMSSCRPPWTTASRPYGVSISTAGRPWHSPTTSHPDRRWSLRSHAIGRSSPKSTAPRPSRRLTGRFGPATRLWPQPPPRRPSSDTRVPPPYGPIPPPSTPTPSSAWATPCTRVDGESRPRTGSVRPSSWRKCSTMTNWWPGRPSGSASRSPPAKSMMNEWRLSSPRCAGYRPTTSCCDLPLPPCWCDSCSLTDHRRPPNAERSSGPRSAAS